MEEPKSSLDGLSIRSPENTPQVKTSQNLSWIIKLKEVEPGSYPGLVDPKEAWSFPKGVVLQCLEPVQVLWIAVKETSHREATSWLGF